jgi:hypothetical protein
MHHRVMAKLQAGVMPMSGRGSWSMARTSLNYMSISETIKP